MSLSSPNEGLSKPLLIAMFLLGLVGLGLSSYLTWVTWGTGNIAGCGDGEVVNCDHVLSSTWSKWLGIPVSLFGVLTYAGILASLGYVAVRNSSLAKTLLLTVSLLAAGSATWFIGLQILVIKSFCIYCMGVHLCSLLLCGLSILLIRSAQVSSPGDLQGILGIENPGEDPSYDPVSISEPSPIWAAGIASLAMIVLLGGQVFFRPPELVYEELAEVPSEVSIEDEDTNAIEAEVFPGESVTGESLTELSAKDKEDLAQQSNLQELAESELQRRADDDPNVEDSVGALEKGDLAKGAMIPSTNTDSADMAFLEEADSISDKRSSGPRLLRFRGLKDPIDVYEMPIIGDPDAKHIIVEMLDYTCSHCRKLHPHVHASIDRYGDQVAFIVFHVPLSKKCNPYVKAEHSSHKHACDYARLALSIWKLDRDKFTEFHNWLMESEKPPLISKAKAFAMKLVGEEVLLDDSLEASAFRKFAGQSTEMRKMHTGLPALLTERGVIRGVPDTRETWFAFLEKTLNIKPIPADL